MRQLQLTVFAVAVLLGSTVNAALVSSTFDSSSEGWVISGDATSGAPTWLATGGNPGGHIQASDSVSGGVWYFQAPSAYLGAMASAYGGTLAFDLRQTGSGSQFNAADVILNGAGLELRFDAPSNPLPVGTWVSYAVTLREGSGWTRGGTAATAAEMLTVLGDLERLRIRGEFISGADIGRLDNVSITAVPLPPAFALFGASLVAAARRRCRARA
jgi:hypothetical protein